MSPQAQISEEKQLAEALSRSLRRWRLQASTEGQGHNWKVRIGTRGNRRAVIHCFFYSADVGLVLGLNPGNARSRLGPPTTWLAGAEYLVELTEVGEIVEGRSRDRGAIVRAVRRWCRGASLDSVVGKAPFIDEAGRSLRYVSRQLDPSLEWEILGQSGARLWITKGLRQCEAHLAGNAIVTTFRLGQAPVAFSEAFNPETVSSWLKDEASVAELAQLDPTVVLEAHVEHIEWNPARWHWLNVLDRIRDDTDVLSPMRELIEQLAASEVVSQFYSYSSMRTLCFSASSHYPWVNQGFPRVDVWNGQLNVDGAEVSVSEAITAIQSVLMKSETLPFFGSAVTLETSVLRQNFVEMGSSLSPQLVLHAGWLRNQLTANGRSCSSSGTAVTFDERENPTYWPDLATVAMVMYRYCLKSEPLAEILADPSRATQWDRL